MNTRNKQHHYFYLGNRDKILNITEHYDDCPYKKYETTPISVCMCNCYEEQIFMIGCEAQRDQFYGGSDRG